MTDERARLVEEIFGEAMRCEGRAREELLLARCGEDAQLMSEIRLLLECAAVGDGVLDGGAPELVNLPRENEDPGLLPAGTRVGPYTIKSVLGVGGMGVVYLGEQAKPNRTVALKVIRPGFATSGVLKRFEYEAELLGRLSHPGIAQIIEAGAAQTPFGVQPFFAMELVEGKPLTEHAKLTGLSVRQKVELMILVCDAVEHAHQRGVIHRDLKPANILVDKTGQPKVLDFGVARATGGREAEQRLTMMRTGERQLVGTLAYMSPEQVAGDARAIDTRSDVYSLGVVLFEMLSGSLPHELKDRALPDAVRVIRDEDPRLLGSADPECRGDLEIICAKALERAPGDRYPSAARLGEDLRRYLADAPIEARPRSAVYHLRKFARRNRGLVWGMAVASIAILAGAVFGAVQYAEAVKSRGVAEDRAAEADRLRVKANAERDAKDRESENLRRSLRFIQERVFALAYEPNADMGRALSIVDALRYAQRYMADGFKGNPLSEARLRYYSALILQSNSEFDWAMIAAERAAKLFAAQPVEYDVERVDAEELYIGLLMRMGRFTEAEKVQAEVMAREPMETATNRLGMQGQIWMAQGDFERARVVMQQQYDMEFPLKGITPLNVYIQTRRLCMWQAAVGKFDESEKMWDERIDAAAKYFGGDSDRAPIQFLMAAGDLFEEAGEWARATRFRRRTNTAMLPDIWMNRGQDVPYQLATNLRHVGGAANTAEALELARSLFNRTRGALGARNSLVHRGAAEVTRCLVACGRVEEACVWGAEAMANFHFETEEWEYRNSDVREAYAEALLAAGRAVEAADLAEAELARRARLRGLPHPTTWESLRLVGACLRKAGRAEEFAKTCQQSLAAELELDSMASNATLTLAQALVEALVDTGDAASAESMARRVLGEKWGEPGTMRKPIVEIHCALARAVAMLRGVQAGDEELGAFDSQLVAKFGPEHPWVLRVKAERGKLAGVAR